jgi:phage repressor protein C with HTH and peptisase S24 domain
VSKKRKKTAPRAAKAKLFLTFHPQPPIINPMTIINYQPLISGVIAFAQSASYAELARKSGISSPTIQRIATGVNKKPSMETWLALHQGAPASIPPPPLRPAEEFLEIIESADTRKIPVFDAGGGKNCYWDDQGYPQGKSNEYAYLPKRETDAKTFAVRVHGNSMAPTIKDGEIAVVVPSMRLQNKQICFYTNYNDPQGEKLIRRYFDYPEQIFLRPDNPEEGFEIILDKKQEHNCGVFKVSHILNIKKL